MRRQLLLTTAVLALALSAHEVSAQSQTGDDQTRRPGAGQTSEPGARPRPEGEGRPGAMRAPGQDAPRRAENGEGQPQRPAAGAATSAAPAGGDAGQRPASTTGTRQGARAAGEARPQGDAGQPEQQRRPETGRAGEGEPGKAADADRARTRPGEKARDTERPAEAAEPKAGAAARNQAPKPGSAEADAARTEGGRGGGRPRVEGRLNVSERDAAALRERLTAGRRDAVTTVRIDAAIGARIPGEVTIREVPAAIVAEYPMVRGYDYVISEERIVIVDPKTREVVEVIGDGGRRTAEAPRKPDLRQRITAEQRQVIRKQVQVAPASRVVFDARTVHEVPDTIVLKPLPDVVVEGVPDVRGYDYFVDSDDHVIIVDPDTRDVVDVLD